MNEIDISDEDLGLTWEEEEPNIMRELINTIEKLCDEIKKLRETIKDD